MSLYDIRKFISIINFEDMMIYSLVSGIAGSVMFSDDPCYGFSLFAWITIIMYISIIQYNNTIIQ
jgi:hypothetical protein